MPIHFPSNVSSEVAPFAYCGGPHEIDLVGDATQVHHYAWFKKLNEIVERSLNLSEVIQQIGEEVSREVGCHGFWYVPAGESRKFAQMTEVIKGREVLDSRLLSKRMRAVIDMTVEQGCGHCCALEVDDARVGQILVAAPVREAQDTSLILVGLFRRSNEVTLKLHWLLGIGALVVQRWLNAQRLKQADSRVALFSAVTQLTRELSQAQDMGSAAFLIVNQLKQILKAEQVAIWLDPLQVAGHVVAISDVESVDRTSSIFESLRAISKKALASQTCLFYPAEQSPATEAQGDLEQYCLAMGQDACIAVPLLTSAQQPLGTILVSARPNQLMSQEWIEQTNRICRLLADHCWTISRAHRGLVMSVVSGVKTFLAGRKGRIVGAVCLLLSLILITPVPYRIHTDCKVQPVQRRFVVAPYTGILEKTLVKTGDVVSQGAVIAVLDGRQLRIELAGLEAQYDGAKKKRDSSLAKGQIAESQIAQSEMTKLEAEIENIQYKLANLEVRSPLAGIVVVGDLDKVAGATVEIGQTLFEIGPLDQMLVEIGIPENEIRYVEPGMLATIKFNAFPFESWQGEIESIHTRAEIIDDQVVFIAELKLPNELLKLKPGMQGKTRIKSHARPLGWNWFHHAYEKARMLLLW
ncbi:MAG TPA: efflux RND transporter periplasmic adaptor subunit [Pirellulaceae bacterium]|nr:efflux RND transporter periplasmic adaptor subunit [Pirellulaceae bacterium]HMO93103.1 efflux RND transporter periplasmic adaptor subunit [Pirellulaceae bacterium]HMP69946.1 efflux RND transporter periplasmic adaptor subunit [Pirellulaceae bacterium]